MQAIRLHFIQKATGLLTESSKPEISIKYTQWAQRFLDIINMLLNDKRVDVNVAHEETALLETLALGLMELIEPLIEKGADLDLVDKYEINPLHRAFYSTRMNKDDETAFTVALNFGLTELIEPMISKGANIRVANLYNSPTFILGATTQAPSIQRRAMMGTLFAQQ